MNNDQNEEVIIEPQEINEPEEELELDVETPEETQEVVEPKKPEESLEDKRARLKRQLEQTEKKLGIKPEKVVANTAVANASLSPVDIIAITRANIDEDDIAEVVEYAKYKNISVSEALKSPVIKNTLAQKAEERTVSLATNTGAARRGTAKVSDEKLLENASKGILPESAEDMERLRRARRGR